LGVEQLAADLQPHAALLPDAADTIAILSEQSQKGEGRAGKGGTGEGTGAARADGCQGSRASTASRRSLHFFFPRAHCVFVHCVPLIFRSLLLFSQAVW